MLSSATANMNHHEGVVCNGCMKANFQGLCYRCLTCNDFDLCSDCYERDFSTDDHPFDHPMKCVLTQMDIELYFGGEYITGDPPQSYRCPYCKEWGFNESTFLSHAAELHPNACPQLISTMVSLYEQQQAARIFLEEEQLMAHAAATTARNRIVNRQVGLELSLHPLNPDGTIRDAGSAGNEENDNVANTTNNNTSNNNVNSSTNIFGQPSSTTSNENRAIRFRIRPRRNRPSGNGSVGSSDDVSGSRGGGNTSGSGDSNTNVSERIERSTGGGLSSAVQNSISHLRNVLRRHTVRQVQHHQTTSGRNSGIHLTLPSIPEHHNTRSTRSTDSIFGTPESLRLAVSDSERAVNLFLPRQATLDSLIASESSTNANDATPTQATITEMMRFYTTNFGAITNEGTNRVGGGSASGTGGAGNTVSGLSSAAAAGGYSFNRSGSTRRARLRILPDPTALQNQPFELTRERLSNFSRAISTLPTSGHRSTFASLLNEGQRTINAGNNHSLSNRTRALRPLSPSFRQRDTNNNNNNNNNTNNSPPDLLNGNLSLTTSGPYRLSLTNNTNDNNNNNNISNAALQARNIIFLRNVDDELRIIDELNLSQVHLPIWPPDEMDSTQNSNSVPVNTVPAASVSSNNENDTKKNDEKEKFLLNAYRKPQQENENYSNFHENRAEFVAELVMSALRDTELDFPDMFLLPNTLSFHNWSQRKTSFDISATVGAGDGGATFDSTSHVSLRNDDPNELETLINDDIDENANNESETLYIL